MLKGKKGSFVLQYFGTMDKGNDRLILEVIPYSATGELEGLSGHMKIIIEEGSIFMSLNMNFEFFQSGSTIL